MRLKIAPEFWLGLGLFWLMDGQRYLSALLAAVAAHEAGHLLALRGFGVQALSLRLGFLDAKITTGIISYRQELFVALAGPGMSLLCCAALKSREPGFAAISLLLGAFNLLPIWPLDGGRALHAGLCLRFDALRAGKASFYIGAFTCAVALGGALWLALARGMGMFPVLLCGGVFARLARYGRGEGN